MSLKVWVKRGGSGDEEALGIHVPADGTAQSVVEACRGVFRHLRPSHVALRTEDGIIVARASPAAALRSHTLELIDVQPAGPAKSRAANASTTITTTANNAAAARAMPSAFKSESPQRHRSAERRRRSPVRRPAAPRAQLSGRAGEVVSTQKGKSSRAVVETVEKSDVSQLLELLWDGLPSFTSPSLVRNVPAVTGVVRTAQHHTEVAGSMIGRNNNKNNTMGMGMIGCDRVVPSGEAGRYLNGKNNVVTVLKRSSPSLLPERVEDSKDMRMMTLDDIFGDGETKDEDAVLNMKNKELLQSAPSPCELVVLEVTNVDEVPTLSSPSYLNELLEERGVVTEAEDVALPLVPPPPSSLPPAGLEGEVEKRIEKEAVIGGVELPGAAEDTLKKILGAENEPCKPPDGGSASVAICGGGEDAGKETADTKDADVGCVSPDVLLNKAPAYFQEW